MAHELYNQLSKYLDASYRRTKNYQQEVDFILRRVGNRPGKKILIDVACGSGGHAELLSKAGFSVYRLYDTHVEAGPFSVETITTPSTFPIQNAAVLSPSLWDVRNAKHSPIAAFLLRLRQPPGSPATQGANDEHGDQRIMHDSRC